MNRKPCKLAGVLLPAILTLAGAGAGWLYYRYYAGCATGTCVIAANPWFPVGFGGVFGLLLGLVLQPAGGGCRSAEIEE